LRSFSAEKEEDDGDVSTPVVVFDDAVDVFFDLLGDFEVERFGGI
jgi:hypothetical protein